MNQRDLIKLGVPSGEPVRVLQGVLAAERPTKAAARSRIAAVLADPASHADNAVWGGFARAVAEARADVTRFVPRDGLAPARYWGKAGEDFDQASVDQLRNACSLPIAAAAALMPDAHVGYGLPIGGVLATENAVVPYAVGVDIACRMRMTVLDMPASLLDHEHGRDRLTKAIEAETRFGIGAAFQKRREHEVMDTDWSVSPITIGHKDRAWSQLGSSGSGNHFVEFGTLTIEDPAHAAALGLEPGVHLALLSHSGSRGTGAAVCNHYSKIAMQRHSRLPKELKHLAWLDLDSEAGAEYFAAMELMGDYAAANHACVHRHITKNLGARAIASVENHHNFAWKETHDPSDGGGPRELIVHRKGATPAGDGVLGIIPGSMAAPGYVVRGKGGAGSLDSASHGAGRVMSRTQAKNSFRWNAVRELLKQRGVTVISAGIDENPLVYKDIETVMARQTDLVEPLARFDPRLVKMAPEGERAED